MKSRLNIPTYIYNLGLMYMGLSRSDNVCITLYTNRDDK